MNLPLEKNYFEALQDPENEITPLDESPKEDQGNLVMSWENEEKSPSMIVSSDTESHVTEKVLTMSDFELAEMSRSTPAFYKQAMEIKEAHVKSSTGGNVRKLLSSNATEPPIARGWKSHKDKREHEVDVNLASGLQLRVDSLLQKFPK